MKKKNNNGNNNNEQKNKTISVSENVYKPCLSGGATQFDACNQKKETCYGGRH